MEETKIQWHAAFVSAMDLELVQNRSDLVYHKEYNLNKKPLEIDLLVIKKDSDIQIANEMGKLFRGHNIVEYKSPLDHLNIDTFYKAGAYACLYKAYGKTVDERKAEDITVSMIRESRPVGLFEYFKVHNIRFNNPYKGIYYVLDAVLFPTQIIITKELNPREHIWLKALSGGMQKRQMRDLFETIERLDLKFDRELADSVLQVSIKANKQVVEELKGEEHMCQALLEIMEPEINKIKDKLIEEVTREVTEEVTREVTEEVTREVTEEVTREVTEEVTREVTREVTEEVTREVTEIVTREVTEEVTKKEREKGIKSLVTALRDCGQGDAEIIKAIEKIYEVSATEAKRYL